MMRLVDPAPRVAGDEAQADAEHEADDGGREGEEDDGAAAVEHAREHVVADVVAAEPRLGGVGGENGGATNSVGEYGATQRPERRRSATMDDEDGRRRSWCARMRQASTHASCSHSRRALACRRATTGGSIERLESVDAGISGVLIAGPS